MVVGESILGQTPWSGSDALYWTEVVLAGPSRAGPQRWSALFAATDLELPHLGSSAEFSFTAVKPPEHRVAVTVIEGDAATPVEKTEVALGPYRAVPTALEWCTSKCRPEPTSSQCGSPASRRPLGP
jgi:hypothetical protein